MEDNSQNIKKTSSQGKTQKYYGTLTPLQKRFESGMLQIENTEKVIIAMVGLPARGKSYFSKKVTKYLQWLGYSTKIFNIGKYRREQVGINCSANFFDGSNEEGQKLRQQAAQNAIDDLIKFLKDGGDVAIYDGTNTTKQRRIFIKEQLNQKLPCHFLFFTEIMCDDPSIISKNIRLTKLSGPDYKDMDQEVAEKDFQKRIQKYEEVYEQVEEDENFPFIKLINMGKKNVVYDITGYLPCKILSFIFHYHIFPRPIYLARAGKQVMQRDVLGGDWDLGEDGKKFGENLADFFYQEFPDVEERKKVKILTSTKISAVETSNFIKLGVKPLPMKCLDELNFGIVNGLTLDTIKESHPEVYQNHMKKDITYRYPGGECFLDLISRLEPVIFEIERSKEPVIVISHHYMLKALYCYFFHLDVEDVMDTYIPKHHVVKIIPDVNECYQDTFNLDNEQEIQSNGAISPKLNLSSQQNSEKKYIKRIDMDISQELEQIDIQEKLEAKRQSSDLIDKMYNSRKMPRTNSWYQAKEKSMVHNIFNDSLCQIHEDKEENGKQYDEDLYKDAYANFKA